MATGGFAMKAWQIGTLVGLAAGILQLVNLTEARPAAYQIGLVVGAMLGGMALGAFLGWIARPKKTDLDPG
jgi:hypothetical protein